VGAGGSATQPECRKTRTCFECKLLGDWGRVKDWAAKILNKFKKKYRWIRIADHDVGLRFSTDPEANALGSPSSHQALRSWLFGMVEDLSDGIWD
jgi:hypothetical protein